MQHGGRVDNTPSFQEAYGSNLDPEAGYPDFVMVFLILSAEMLGKYFNSGDCPGFIYQQRTSHLMQYNVTVSYKTG